MATSAATSAATAAATPAVDPVDLVNLAAGSPAQEIWPGALDPSQYTDPGTIPPGAPAGPLGGGYGAQQFSSDLPEMAPGGGYQDAASDTGHDAPQVPWDSSAGAPFAPSGALDPGLHALDTGGVYVREHVAPAAIGKLTRRTLTGQTTVRSGTGDQVTKDNVTSPNNRADLDQYQDHNPDGFDPWEIPYGERPVLNNLAWQNVATEATGSPYAVGGLLSDRSTYDYSAEAYSAPPDPTNPALPSAASAYDSGIGGGWV